MVENCDFSYVLAFNAHVKGVPVGILTYCLVWKIENGLATQRWKKFEDTCNHFDRIPACDGQKRTHIQHLHSPRYAYASCSKTLKMTTVESAAITSFKHDHVHYVSEHGFIYYSTHCHFGIRLSSTDELSAQLTENIQKKQKSKSNAYGSWPSKTC